MDFLNIRDDYIDPEGLPIEVVERKGIGHPDSLADALANEVSNAFSELCLKKFGFVLHHNIDKLYIGAGHFRNDFGTCDRIAPVEIRINGRMSSECESTPIEIAQIQSEAVEKYLTHVLPHLQADDYFVTANASQKTKVPYWFTPRDRGDVPDADQTKANDTSICIAHWPPTAAESLAYRLERYFWNDVAGMPVPNFSEIGQDIKVMVLRQGSKVEVTLCVPAMSRHTSSHDHYLNTIRAHELALNALVAGDADLARLRVHLNINPYQHRYMLGIGSCIECGEEGLVGRGNAISGVISSYRSHTQESWAGKNPVYHTGRVYGFLTNKLAKSIGTELGVKCSVTALTRCGDTLVPPMHLGISVNKTVNVGEVRRLVDRDILSANYLREILAFRPWIERL